MSTHYFGAAESMLLRHETYQAAFRRMTLLAAASAAIGVAGFAFGVWGVTKAPETKYFVAQKNGQILPIVSLDQPFLNQDQLTAFVSACVTKALSLNFVNWKEQLSAAQPCFTPNGWRELMAEMGDRSGTLDFIVNRKLNSLASVKGVTIVKQGHDGTPLNRYVWRLKVPISVSFESSKEKTHQDMESEIDVVRTETYENDHGVAIHRITAKAK